jgi:YYY domain-containing protein
MNGINTAEQITPRNTRWGNLLLIAALLLTVAGGAYLRLVGINLDEDQHMHPDERFLSLVQVAISPVENPGEYFDTENSSLNPANRGYTFFVYGTLPIFIVRYTGEVLGRTDYHAITILGRQLSAVFDLVTIVLVFAIGKRLYHQWVGLLGAVFYALAVLPIQLSHFATVDTITNTFAALTMYAAVWALTRPAAQGREMDQPEPSDADASMPGDDAQPNPNRARFKYLFYELAPYLLFGIALGAATASKINAVVLALILPLVEGMRYLGMDPDERREAVLPIIRNLIIAAVLSFVTFRIGQPYAFNGPGFFNFGINQTWWSGLQSLRVQASGAVDFPPALQWARRSISFSGENLVAWGLGWPLGILAGLSYLGMGYLILRKEAWRRHLPLWAFTGVHFIWQSTAWVSSMRYQMLIYPLLALFAGWGLVRLWSARRGIKLGRLEVKPKVIRITGIFLTVGIILGTVVWAFAFSRIYTRQHTRAAASRWIYQNIPGALTLHIETNDGLFKQPLPYRAGDTLTSGTIFSQPFISPADGLITTVSFPHIMDQAQSGGMKTVVLSIVSANDLDAVLPSAWVESEFLPTDNHPRGMAYEFILDIPLRMTEGALYFMQLTLPEANHSLILNGSPSMEVITDEGMVLNSPLPRIQQSIRVDQSYSMSVRLVESGSITLVSVPYVVDQSGLPGVKTLTLDLQISDQGGFSRSSSIRANFPVDEDVRGGSFEFVLSEPLAVEAGQTLAVSLSTEQEGAQLVLHAPAPAHESSWDDAIPYPVDGFSPYSEGGGIYRGDLNFEMYWPDDQNKLARFESILDQADFIFMTSNRQWGTTTRVPERYLLTTFYYRHLLGCPEDEDILWCYSVAEPGMFAGSLGFELVAVFQSNPNLGPIEFNTQFAEEAFTVYDHPKVLIFQKSADYDPIAVRNIMRSVDLSRVVYFTPGEAASYRGPDPGQLYEPHHNLMLPADQLDELRASGTWAELFDRESLVNRSQVAATAVFYVFVLVLGWVSYPVVRLALPGLADRGYPFSKLAGLLLMAFFVWILGSLGVPVTRQMIWWVLLGLAAVGSILLFMQRKILWQSIKEEWRYYLIIEALGLIAFVLFLLVRTGNPDLWHPFKGGEKPMDFSYLNAVIKSITFPPFDPWFAGGYINYYYYGFVIVGMPIKLLGIIPAVAYNLVLPLWYSLLILGAFSVGWNLYQGIPRPTALRVGEKKGKHVLGAAFGVGLVTAILLAVLGNLGTVKLLLHGFQRIAAGGMAINEASLGQQIGWTLQGFVQFLQGTRLPFYPGDWYWFPSRVIPGEPITEFPYFTFIYADLHAHLIAFPITVLAISWGLSAVLSKARWGEKDGRFKIIGLAISFILGGIVIGALRPTNTWDFYTYLVFSCAALLYSILKHYRPQLKLNFNGSQWVEKIGVALIAILTLVSLSLFLYQPFAYWFGQGYTQVDLWEGTRTPLDSYFTHWGLFLFIIVSWMIWETYHWMKTTPSSALRKLIPYRAWISMILAISLILLVVFFVMGVPVGMIALPLGLWVVVLMLRPDRSDAGRFHLFMIGTALTLTLAVELIYLPGDIGRMNSVFKFYLQAWILFALSAGVCFVWLLKSLRYWRNHLVFLWQLSLFLLVVSAALFTVMGTKDKINDRMVPDAPQGLDGMAFMAYATYYDMGINMQLVEDYYAIRWMQDHIEGSPVILEGQAYEYRWGNRYTIYTGLPGVVGWNWHQRQQRAVLRNTVVQDRVNRVNTFFTTEDIAYAVEFIQAYDVAYIVVGQLEQAFYPESGLEKFNTYDGQLWDAVYRVGSTTIYQVRE